MRFTNIKIKASVAIVSLLVIVKRGRGTTLILRESVSDLIFNFL